jgi:hypothetical protein
MKEWGINTLNGSVMLNIDFFKRIRVNKIKKSGEILFINIDYGDAISILEKDWKEIELELRDIKISKLLNKKTD